MQSKDRSWVPGSKFNLAKVSQKIICDACKALINHRKFRWLFIEDYPSKN